jgi:hypothetical protein
VQCFEEFEQATVEVEVPGDEAPCNAELAR